MREKMYICKICNSTFDNYWSAENHVWNKHKETHDRWEVQDLVDYATVEYFNIDKEISKLKKWQERALNFIEDTIIYLDGLYIDQGEISKADYTKYELRLNRFEENISMLELYPNEKDYLKCLSIKCYFEYFVKEFKNNLNKGEYIGAR